MRRKILLLVAIFVLLGNFSFSLAANKLSIIEGYVRNFTILKDQDVLALDETPVIINNRIYLPLRAIAEALDYEVKWYENTKTILLKQSQLSEKLSPCDPFIDEYYIYGEIRKIHSDDKKIEIEQHLDHHSREVFDALPLKENATILLQRHQHYMEISFQDLKLGDVVGIIVTNNNKIRGIIVDS